MNKEKELERIRLRCVCGEDGCWLWSGSVNRSGIPTLSRTVNGERKNMSARRWVYDLSETRKIAEGEMVVTTCQSASCLNPRHLKAMTRSAVQRRNNQIDPGLRLRRGVAIQASWARKGAGHKITTEQANYARSSTTPSKDVAAELGISLTMVNHIRAGGAWRVRSPFAGLMR